jgi:hypothetical protein
MVLEIFTVVGNLTRAGCVVLSKAWGKMVFFIIDAMVILPFVKKFPMKKYLFGKFPRKISCIWNIFHENYNFSGNLQ